MTDVDRKTKNIVVRCLRPYKGYGLPRESHTMYLLLAIDIHDWDTGDNAARGLTCTHKC